MPTAAHSPATPPRDTVPASTLTWSAIATLLELPPVPDRDLTQAQVFDGPGGLVCRLAPEHVDGAMMLRPTVHLGLHVDDVPRDGVGTLLSMQAMLLNSGRWFLGMDDQGGLQLAALFPAGTAAEVAGCLCEGGLAAWTTLRSLLQPDASRTSSERGAAEKATV